MQNKCCFCNKEIKGYGNNPEPVRKQGMCCEECNLTIVIPERIYRYLKLTKKI